MAARTAALVEGDVEQMTEILADDFTYTNASGESCDRDGYVASYVGSPDLVWLPGVLRAGDPAYGDTAVVTLDVHDRAIWQGEPFEGDFRSLFVYVRRDGTGAASPARRRALSAEPRAPGCRRHLHHRRRDPAAMTSRPDRRHALTLAATVGISPAVLAACGGDETATDSPDESLDTGHAPDRPTPGRSPARPSSRWAAVILPDEQVVVTQPAEGEFKCFTAVCTHRAASSARCRPAASAASATAAPSRSRTARREPAGHGRPGRVAITVDGDEISIA